MNFLILVAHLFQCCLTDLGKEIYHTVNIVDISLSDVVLQNIQKGQKFTTLKPSAEGFNINTEEEVGYLL